MGHSEGGIIAPMVAARSPDVAFIVLMAGTGLPGEEILYLQGQAILKAMGADEKALKDQLEVQKRLFEVVKTEKDEKAAGVKLRDVTKTWTDSLSKDQRKALGNVDAFIARQLKMASSPWFHYFLTYDPRPALAKVHCPVLALIGEKDRQVPARENLSQIESTLKTAGNNRVTVKELPGLNHLFQKCKTGAPSEYVEIEQTIDPMRVGRDRRLDQRAGGIGIGGEVADRVDRRSRLLQLKPGDGTGLFRPPRRKAWGR